MVEKFRRMCMCFRTRLQLFNDEDERIYMYEFVHATMRIVDTCYYVKKKAFFCESLQLYTPDVCSLLHFHVVDLFPNKDKEIIGCGIYED